MARRERLDPREDGYRQFLSRNGWYRSIPIADLEPARLGADFFPYHVLIGPALAARLK